ncbi:MAG: 16S rRNA (cytidine(1402)-2'-O)-methyltransferase [Saprospiraceae bacterium]|nr:16S rRNA (cytidine(1402)-2'-O)-methyltransferase [Saprospiraceae bacterium]
MLYIVPTPIGNIEDITLRAIRILKEADIILAEDTRTSGRLLKHYEIDTPMRSYHAFNEHKTTEQVVSELVNGADMALISDAGTPGISDPGYLLIREAIKSNVEVVCLPGATAVIPALVKSGLPCEKYFYEGFLPHKKGRKTRWEFIASSPVTVVLYESPHRIVKCIKEVVQYCGPERHCAIIREISKIYEEAIRGTASDVLEEIQNRKLKGEIVVVIQGASD